jgi:hypothetical protein
VVTKRRGINRRRCKARLLAPGAASPTISEADAVEPPQLFLNILWILFGNL